MFLKIFSKAVFIGFLSITQFPCSHSNQITRKYSEEKCQALSDSLFSKSWVTRRNAADSLAMGMNVCAISALVRALAGDSLGISKNASIALVAAGPEAADSVATLSTLFEKGHFHAQISYNARETLFEIKKKYNFAPCRTLIELLYFTNYRRKKLLIKLLGNLECKQAVSVLKHIAQTDSFSIKEASLSALSKIGDSTLFPWVTQFIDENLNKEMAKAVVSILKNIGGSKTIPPLLSILSSRSQYGQYEARKALANLGIIAADTLISLLSSKNSSLRHNCARALGMMKCKKAASQLMDLLNDSVPMVKASALYALGNVEHGPAIGPALSFLQDSLRDLREEAHTALHKMHKIFLNQLRPMLKVSVDSTAKIDTAGISYMHNLFVSPKGEMCSRWASNVPSPGWIKALQDEICVYVKTVILQHSGLIRRKAFNILYYFRNPKNTRFICRLLKDPDQWMRKAAITTLLEFEDPSTVSHIIPLLSDSDSNVKYLSCFFLSKYKPKGTVPQLIGMIKQKDSPVDSTGIFNRRTRTKMQPLTIRSIAVYTLGELGDSTAVDILTHTLLDTNPRVRLHAVIALTKIAHENAVKPLYALIINEENKIILEKTIEALGEFGDTSAVEKLIPFLNNQKGYLKRQSIIALGKLKSQKAKFALFKKLDDQEQYLKDVYVEALLRSGDASFLIPSFEILKKYGRMGYYENYWYEFSKFIPKRFNYPAAIDTLLVLLQHDDQKTVNRVLQILVEIDNPLVIDKVVPFLKHDSSVVRERAVKILAEKHNKNTISYLTDLLSDSCRSVRIACFDALCKIGDARVVPELINAVKSGKIDFKMGDIESITKWKIWEKTVKWDNTFYTLADTSFNNFLIKCIQKGEWLAVVYLNLDPQKEFQSLILLLDVQKPEIRSFAIKMLGESKNASVLKMLEYQYQHSEWPTNRWCHSAYRSIKESLDTEYLNEMKIVDILIAIHRNRIIDTCEIIRNCLSVDYLEKLECIRGKVKSPELTSSLIKNITSSGARQALEHIGNSAADSIIDFFKNNEIFLKPYTYQILSTISDTNSLPDLIEFTYSNNFNIRQRAVEAIGNIGKKSAQKCLINLLNDSIPVVHAAAIYALAKIGSDYTNNLLKKMDIDYYNKNYLNCVQDYHSWRKHEAPLIIFLHQFGTKEIATDLLNCNNAGIEYAAQKWLEEKEFKVMHQHTQGGIIKKIEQRKIPLITYPM